MGDRSALVPAAGESKVDKQYGDSFADTDLESVLSRLGVSRIVLCGAQTDFCIQSTMYGAVQRGYDVTLVEDAHTTDHTEFRGQPLSAEMLVLHLNRTASTSSLPGISWDTQPTASVRW